MPAPRKRRSRGGRPPRSRRIDLATQAYWSGRIQEAAGICDQILASQPRRPDALHLLGVISYQTRRPVTAIALLERAIEIRPDRANYHYDLGNAFVAAKELDRAASAYQRAIDVDTRFADAYNNLGSVLRYLGRPAAAVGVYQAALQLQPDASDLYQNLGLVYLDLSRPEDAAGYFQRAIELDADSTQAQFDLGVTLSTLGRTKEAAASYRKAAAGKKHYLAAYNNLYLMLVAEGKYEEAGKWLEIAAEYADEEHPATNHLRAALRGESTETAPRAYVAALFDDYAASFETHLVQGLAYRTPAALRTMLSAEEFAERRFANALDLGCGTGLGGLQFAALTERFTGVDLSQKMIGEAARKHCYDELHVADLEEYLARCDQSFDLFVATDVFVYIGNLSGLFAAVRARATDDALFLFSTEHTLDGTYALLPTGRYAHSRAYIAALAQGNGFSILHCEGTELRKEGAEWIHGDLYVLAVST